MDRVIHFEIPADNKDRAHRFYQDVFGWKVNAMPEFDYAIVETGPFDQQTGPKEPGFINGGILGRQDPVTRPVITIGVASIDDSAKKIEANGGKVVRGRMAVGAMGFSAYFTDSEGNLVGLWENAG